MTWALLIDIGKVLISDPMKPLPQSIETWYCPWRPLAFWTTLIFMLAYLLSAPNLQNLTEVFFAGARGFQDIGFALKYRPIRTEWGPGRISFLGTAGFSTPFTNYLSDYRPYSIGAGVPEFSLRAIAQYEFKNQLYFRASAAQLWRGYTEAERDYYYNDGSYYTAWMDVPNAWTYETILGKWLFDTTLKLELSYSSLTSTSGDDIRAYNAAQPTNKVEVDRLGFSAQYYFKSIKGLGIVAYHNRVVDGRNTPKMSNTGFGLTYQFNVIKKTN